jgi:hypothetical protein
MAWTYSDFEDTATYTTAAARLARLNLHIGEVQAAVSADVSADGKSRSVGSLVQYLAQLRKRQTELEGGPAAMTGGGFSKIRRS